VEFQVLFLFADPPPPTPKRCFFEPRSFRLSLLRAFFRGSLPPLAHSMGPSFRSPNYIEPIPSPVEICGIFCLPSRIMQDKQAPLLRPSPSPVILASVFFQHCFRCMHRDPQFLPLESPSSRTSFLPLTLFLVLVATESLVFPPHFGNKR